MLPRLVICVLILIPLIGICQKKSALIIGNDNYKYYPNKLSSVKQCFELEKILNDLGYEVTLITNGKKRETEQAIYKFYQEENSISFFFYSGHIFKGKYEEEIYLVPVDVNKNITLGDRNRFDLISLRRIQQELRYKSSELNILMFDMVSSNKRKFKWDLEDADVNYDIPKALSRYDRTDRNMIISTNEKTTKKRSNEKDYLQVFIEELQKPNQSIINTFRNLSYRANSSLYTSLFIGKLIPELLWNGKLHQEILTDFETMPPFPFPPPKASASYIVEKKYFKRIKNLFDIGRILDNSLIACGYHERSYYQIPGGFALVTRIEKIKKDVSPFPEPERWSAPHEKEYIEFSLKDYFRSLFYAREGKYRIIVFLITSIPFNQAEDEMSLYEAKKYLKRGYNSLPTEFQFTDYSKKHVCTALIYEFDKNEFEKGELVELSKFLGRTHLRKNNFISILRNVNEN